MPKLGLTMESGTIIDWLVPDGAEVSENMPVLLIETDKVETEVEAGGAGILQRSGRVGETYSCGERLGWILEIGESLAKLTGGEDRPAGRTNTQTPTLPLQGESTVEPRESGNSTPHRLVASPNARRIAANLGIDLAEITGSGPGGRIVGDPPRPPSRHGNLRISWGSNCRLSQVLLSDSGSLGRTCFVTPGAFWRGQKVRRLLPRPSSRCQRPSYQ